MAAPTPTGSPKPAKADVVESTKSNPSDTDAKAIAGTGKEPKLGPSPHKDDLGMLGAYRVQKKIGLGGMGIVYLGFDESLHRNVALKVMLPTIAVNKSARDRFLREARASAAVEHPHVVSIYAVSEHDGVPFLAMQYLKGAPLDKYLAKKGPPSVAQILRVGRETAEGLAAAHAKGLVHRDIKPANLWLEVPHGRVKILDFGLAKPSSTDSEESTELTQVGAVVGTPAYMAPEQGRGEAVDHRTDLYSLGAVLYRLCTGRQPFTGPNVMAVLSALALDTPKPIRSINPDIPLPLSNLIHKLLEKDPANRYQTATELANAFKALEKTIHGSGVQPAMPAAPLAPSAPPPDVAPQPQGFVMPPPQFGPPQYAPGYYPPPQYPPQSQYSPFMQISSQDDVFANLDDGPPTNPSAAHQSSAPISSTSSSKAPTSKVGASQISGSSAAKRSGTSVNSAIKPAAGAKSSKKWLLIGGSVAVVAVIGGLIAVFSGGSKPVAEAKPETPAATPKKEVVKKPQAVTAPVSVVPGAKGKLPPLSEAFLAEMKAASPEQQKTLLEKEFTRRHQAFEGNLTTQVEGQHVVGVTMKSVHVTDLTPLRALPALKSLTYNAPNATDGPMTDLTPLEGLPIESLSLIGHPRLNELKPLKDLPLKTLNLSYADITDVTPLAGKGFVYLNLNHCRDLSDIKPLDTCAVETLILSNTGVADLSPLAEVNLKSLAFNLELVKDLTPLVRGPLERLSWEPSSAKMPMVLLAPLRNKSSLKELQKSPASLYWQHYDGRAAATVKPVKIIPASDNEVNALAFNADGSKFAAAGADSKVRIWNTATGELLHTMTASAIIHNLAFLGMDIVITRSPKQVTFWNATTGSEEGEPIMLVSESASMAVSPDGKKLAVGPWSNSTDKFRILLWSLPDRKPLDSLRGQGSAVTNLAFTQDGKYLAAAGHNRRQVVWDVGTGEPAFKKDIGLAGNCHTAVFSPDDTRLLHCDEDETVKVIDWKTGIEAASFPVMQPTRVRFDPDGKQILTGSRDGWLNVCDLTGKPLAFVNGTAFVKNIIFSPDAKTIMTSHTDGKIRVWDAKAVLGK
ncbi:hypothetical protein BH11PLA2_BH11PLA2_41130 [soil metagenome]